MRVAIVTTQVPFVRGGAELLAEGLQAAMTQAGHEAEIIALPFKWYPPTQIVHDMLTARLLHAGDRCERLIGLKFPAYLMPHPSKRLWIAHQHRSAYERWDSEDCDLRRNPDGRHVRETIIAADDTMFAGCEAIYTISGVVSARLRQFNGVVAEPLWHPPPGADALRPGGYDGSVLFPSRINDLKRQHLAIEALALTLQPVRLAFFGGSDAPPYYAALRARCTALGLDARVDWHERVSDDERLALYADCRAVMFVPVDEDYGYVTLEAMLCAKSVLTATDSGGPLDFVEDGVNGTVCPPEPAALAAALDQLWADRPRAQAMGQAGASRYRDMQLGWTRVLDRLLG